MGSSLKNLVGRVVRRYVASVAPPRWMGDAIKSGHLDKSSLTLWSDVIRVLGGHFDFDSAETYWLTKANQKGLEVPKKLLPSQKDGEYAVEVGDTVEDWAKQTARSVLVTSQLKTKAKKLDNLQDLLSILGRYTNHTAPSEHFEKDYQFHLILISKLLSSPHYDEEKLNDFLRKLDKILSLAGA